jgi:hypothetical protein
VPSPLDLYVSEKEWQAKVEATARYQGWWCYHPLRSRGSEKGWPDLVMLRPPTALFIELKAEKTRVTPEQRMVMNLLERCTEMQVGLWRPSDWPLVERTLR